MKRGCLKRRYVGERICRNKNGDFLRKCIMKQKNFGVLGEKYDHNSCHVRTTNIGAIGFYEKIGFEKEKLVQRYYEDMGDAWYLVYSPNL